MLTKGNLRNLIRVFIMYSYEVLDFHTSCQYFPAEKHIPAPNNLHYLFSPVHCTNIENAKNTAAV